ncbi:MAG: galactokinase [Gemmatimonadetes bacterium]|nr:galactokinase [Gemmatimonadota bacterium]
MSEPMAEAFRERFGAEPTHACRAPGRVNLIGEHTDYNGLPVLPMALQREVRIALVPRGAGLVRLANTDPEFGPVEFEVGVAIEPGPPGHWGNYVKAPAQELARRFAIFRGFDGILASDVPVASGLSSSSALVNAVGLALAEINEVGLEALALGDAMADAERYTGTRGGGMDQAISMAARAGHAARIDFHPLRLRHVPIPEDWRFVVADTGVRAEKSGPAQAAYNRRRAECEAAVEAVSAELVRVGRLPRQPKGYAQLLHSVHDDEALQASERVLDATLVKRFRHVVTENARVVKAQDLLRQADHSGFGMLMDASHGSLRTDYNVSSAELDELVALAKEGGAAGARLTGAGFGGCIVALASPGTVDEVVEALVAGYYEPRKRTDRLERRLFLAVPSDGASYRAL